MLMASEGATVAVAVLTGGFAGAIVTGVIGPILADRQGRYETYRKWQLDVANEVITKTTTVRRELGSDSASGSSVNLVDDLEVLARRVDLVFARHKGAPNAATEIVDAARLKPADMAKVDTALARFVFCASDEIRNRVWWNRSKFRP